MIYMIVYDVCDCFSCLMFSLGVPLSLSLCMCDRVASLNCDRVAALLLPESCFSVYADWSTPVSCINSCRSGALYKNLLYLSVLT